MSWHSYLDPTLISGMPVARMDVKYRNGVRWENAKKERNKAWEWDPKEGIWISMI